MVKDINWHFKVENMMDYYTGIVHTIDESYIWTEHPQTHCKNCIALEHVISIAEEQFLSEQNPEHKQIIEEYRKEKPLSAEKTKVESKKEFVDIEDLMELAN